MTSTRIYDELKTWLNAVYREETKADRSRVKWLQRGCSFLGISLGSASAYIMYLLSAEFGETTCNYLGIVADSEKSALKNLFGLTAAIPMAALAALNVNDSLRSLSSFFTKPTIKNPTLFKNKAPSELLLRGLFAISAPCSSIPQSTLTWNHISDPATRAFFTTCAVAGPTFFNGRGGQKLIDHCKPKSRAVSEIENYLQKCQRLLKEMPDSEYQIFLQKILGSEGELNDDFLKSLFSLTRADSHTENKRLVQLFSFSGGCLGLISALIFYQLALAGLEDPLQVEAPGLKHLLASLAYLLNAALSCLATAKVFEGIHDLLFGTKIETSKQPWPKIRKLFAFIAILIAPFAALPLGSLQLANAQEGSLWQKLLIGPTFLGPSCVRSSALYDLLNRSFDFINQSTPLSDPRRVGLLKTIEQLQFSVKDLNKEAINSLEGIKDLSQGLSV